MGIAAGNKILLDAETDYAYTDPVSSTEYTRTRRPVTLLITGGDSTYGWLDYSMVGENGTTYTDGNGNPLNGDIGTDLAMIPTGVYFKREITHLQSAILACKRKP